MNSTSLMGKVMAACAVTLAVLLLGAGSIFAQAATCPCDHITVRVDANVACKATICYQITASSVPVCVVLAPGDQVQVPCPLYAIGIRECDGTLYDLKTLALGSCTPSLGIAHQCCVRVCHSGDPLGCPVLDVQAAPCATGICP